MIGTPPCPGNPGCSGTAALSAGASSVGTHSSRGSVRPIGRVFLLARASRNEPTLRGFCEGTRVSLFDVSGCEERISSSGKSLEGKSPLSGIDDRTLRRMAEARPVASRSRTSALPVRSFLPASSRHERCPCRRGVAPIRDASVVGFDTGGRFVEHGRGGPGQCRVVVMVERVDAELDQTCRE